MTVVPRGRQQSGRLDLDRTQAEAQAEAVFDSFHLERRPHLAHRYGQRARVVREHARRACQRSECAPDLAGRLFPIRVVVRAAVARVHQALEGAAIGGVAQEFLLSLKLIQAQALAATPSPALAQSLQDRKDRQSAAFVRHLPDQALAIVCNLCGLAQPRIQAVEQARPAWHAQHRSQGRGQRRRGIAQGLQDLVKRGRAVWASQGFAATLALQAQAPAVPGRQVHDERRLAFILGRPPTINVPFLVGQGRRIGGEIDPPRQVSSRRARLCFGRQPIVFAAD